MKTDIILKIENQEQLDKVQEIVFANGGKWFQDGAKRQRIESLFNGKYIEIDEEKDINRIFKSNSLIESTALCTNLFIKTNGTCEKTKEDNKMEWIEYNGQELEKNKDYLISHECGTVTTRKYLKTVYDKVHWKENIKAYMELPEPYRPKTLKDRLDEAVEKYCYKFSDEEWKDRDIDKFFIAYDFFTKEFNIDTFGDYTAFSKFYFKARKNVISFINSFTQEELMQIMKGEVH